MGEAEAEPEGLGDPDPDAAGEAGADDVGLAVAPGEPVAEADVDSGVGDVDGLDGADAEAELSGLGLPVLVSSARMSDLADIDAVGEGSEGEGSAVGDSAVDEAEGEPDAAGSSGRESEGVGDGLRVRMTPGVQGSGSSTLAGPTGVLADSPAVMAAPCPASPASVAATAQRLRSGATVGSAIAPAAASATIATGHLRSRRRLRRRA